MMQHASALDEVLALRSEVARLRTALIQTGNNIGAALSDRVTTEFLLHVPEEASLKVKRLTRERDASRISTDETYRQLMAERERCAKVAEWFDNVEQFTAAQIAARIRSGK